MQIRLEPSDAVSNPSNRGRDETPTWMACLFLPTLPVRHFERLFDGVAEDQALARSYMDGCTDQLEDPDNGTAVTS